MMHPFGADNGLLLLLWKCLAYALAIGLAVFFYRMYQMRMLIRRAQKEYGVPIIPHSFLFGHLLAVAKIHMKRKIPQDLHGHWMFKILEEEFPEVAKSGVIYFDPWPIGFPMLAVLHPDMIAQFTVTPSLPKFSWMRETEFYHFSGGVDIVTGEGQLWKEQRAIYNPGFSARNVTAMAPWFLEEVLVFKDRLLKAADSGDTIKLETYAMDLTFDVIARAVFNMRTKSQEQKAPAWLDALREQIRLLYFNLDIPKQLNPTIRFQHYRYNRILKEAIVPLVEDSYANYTKPDGPKTIVGLAVKRFVEEGKPIPPDVMDKIVKNIKMFLFGGHETTSTTIALMLYMLSRNPEKLAAMRAEHDAIFGPDPSQAVAAIQADVTILNKLVYTSAVVKELLRMYPPLGGGIRESFSPDFLLTHPETGARFPTYGLMIHGSATTLGRDPKFWHRPDEFMPERFLVRDESDPLYPRKNAWQPFSLGPRACIGQEMVQLEVRLTLVLTAREIEIIPDYPEDAPSWFGEKAYQVALSDAVPSARIKDELPVKIKRRAI